MQKSEFTYYKGSEYYMFKSIFSSISLPRPIETRVNQLVKHAVDKGVLSYVAYASALRYVLEHENPEYLLIIDLPELPLRGYAKCIRIWSELGVIKNTSRKDVVIKVIRSREFESILSSEGIPTNLLNTIRQKVIQHINDNGVPKGSLRKIVRNLIPLALKYVGEAYE